MELTLFKGRSTNFQQICEKMLNILSHQGNADQKYIGISSHSSHNGFQQESQQQLLVRTAPLLVGA
jgi:ERCC4-related helicase